MAIPTGRLWKIAAGLIVIASLAAGEASASEPADMQNKPALEELAQLVRAQSESQAQGQELGVLECCKNKANQEAQDAKDRSILEGLSSALSFGKGQ